jgi:hypothetical protein
MKKSILYAGLFGAGIVCGAATIALAQSTTSPNAVAIGGAFSAVQSWILTVVGALASAAIAWVSKMLNDRLGISVDDSLRNALQTATTNAAGLVLNGIGNQLQGRKLDVGEVGNNIVQYVFANVPDAIKHFGLDQDRIANMILAKVPQIANTTPSPNVPANPTVM